MNYSVDCSRINPGHVSEVMEGLAKLLDKHYRIVGTNDLLVTSDEQSRIVIYPKVGQIEAVVSIIPGPKKAEFDASSPSEVGFSLDGARYTIKYKPRNS